MSGGQQAPIETRKKPRQVRSAALVATILEAAVQVLEREGAGRFTTSRVAERAGVSVGSVYQYFPNKAAILFRLQSDEWRATTGMLRDILENGDEVPDDRLRRLVRTFVRSECEEAAVRDALGEAAPRYLDAPEARAAGEFGTRAVRSFMMVALPDNPDADRDLAASLVMTTLTEVGKNFSETPRPDVTIAAYADAMADMFCAYLASLREGVPTDDTDSRTLVGGAVVAR